MNTRYSISTGSRNKMYTLWATSPEWSGDRYVDRTSYVRTLAHDKDEAIEKAKAYVGDAPLDITGIEVDDIAHARDIDHTIMKHGKNEGLSIYQIDSNYLSWYANNYDHSPSKEKMIALIIEELDSRFDCFNTEKGWNSTAWLCKRLQQQNEYLERVAQRAVKAANASYVGEVGERLTKDLKEVFSKSFDGTYGTFYIVKYEDQDGNSYTYKGSSPPNIYNDEFTTATFTIKDHDEYKGEKQNVIQRVKAA